MKDADHIGILKWDFNKPPNTSTIQDLAINIRDVRLPQRPIKKKETPTSTSHYSQSTHMEQSIESSLA
jgi:hypothetical protein